MLDGPLDDLLFAETLKLFFETRDARDRDILWLYLQGVDTPGIAKDMRLSQRTVQRSIRRAMEWLQQRANDAELVETASRPGD